MDVTNDILSEVFDNAMIRLSFIKSKMFTLQHPTDYVKNKCYCHRCKKNK